MRRTAPKTWIAVALAIEASLTPVASSNVRAIGYDPETRVMTVRFCDHGKTRGGLYEYYDVDAADVCELMTAPSIGHQLAIGIKPFFDYKQIG
jgi:hypothetical protein